jgi:hypothetical protein
MWLVGGLEPDHNTVNRFRSEHLKDAVNDIFTQVVVMLAEMGRLSLDVAYIDGIKLDSRANRYTFVWRRSVEKNKAKLETKIRKVLEYIDEGIMQDNQSDGEPPVPVNSGIDFVINNNSSYDLYNVGIELIGKLESNTYTTSFISSEPGGIPSGSSAGSPNNGINVSVPAGTSIYNIYLNIYARIADTGGTVYVRAALDNVDTTGSYVNFSNNGNFISDYLGNDYGLSLFDTFIPFSGRRMLTITIQDNW